MRETLEVLQLVDPCIKKKMRRMNLMKTNRSTRDKWLSVSLELNFRILRWKDKWLEAQLLRLEIKLNKLNHKPRILYLLTDKIKDLYLYWKTRKLKLVWRVLFIILPVNISGLQSEIKLIAIQIHQLQLDQVIVKQAKRPLHR